MLKAWNTEILLVARQVKPHGAGMEAPDGQSGCPAHPHVETAMRPGQKSGPRMVPPTGLCLPSNTTSPVLATVCAEPQLPGPGCLSYSFLKDPGGRHVTDGETGPWVTCGSEGRRWGGTGPDMTPARGLPHNHCCCYFRVRPPRHSASALRTLAGAAS